MHVQFHVLLALYGCVRVERYVHGVPYAVCLYDGLGWGDVGEFAFDVFYHSVNLLCF